MAKVYVGSARSDENNAAHGGKAGDQKGGKEVSTQAWYRHSKGWRVFRAKDEGMARVIGEQMAAACANENIGYDQYERYDLFKEAGKVGYDLSKVTTPTECDCSELVRCCCAAAGIMNLPTNGFRTFNMPTNLLKCGYFVELKGTKYTESSEYLGMGDILVTPVSGHTVVVLNNGDRYEGTVEEREWQLGERTIRNGDEGADVKLMQEYLLKLGYDLGKWGADGDYGDATELAVTEFQKKEGLEADGVYGPKSHAKLMEVISEDKPAQAGRTVRVEGGQCYVRSAPNTTGAKLGVAKRDSVHPYQGEVSADGWLLIEFEGRNGWVSGRYGKLVAG